MDSEQDLNARVAALEQKVSFLLKHLGLEAQAAGSAPQLDEVQALLVQGRLIEAIKVYRERTGLGLREAKDAVEQMQSQLRH